MRSAFALAALAGVALAAPSYGYDAKPQNQEVNNNVQYNKVENVKWVVETLVKTVTVEGAAPTTVPEQSYDSDDEDDTPEATSTVVYNHQTQPQVTPKPAPPQGYPTTPKPATSAPAQGYPTTPSTGTGTGYMAIVNKYAGIIGRPTFTQDSKLESNARDCVAASPGNMVHKLNAGTYGQVLAPGTMDKFEHIFVGGWICEKPALLGAQSSLCNKDKEGQGWMYTSTGHADIIADKKYTKIGCACVTGICGCDFGY